MGARRHLDEATTESLPALLVTAVTRLAPRPHRPLEADLAFMGSPSLDFPPVGLCTESVFTA